VFLFMRESAAQQQVVAPDRAVESLFEACVAFDAFWFMSGVTASAARRVSSQPLADESVRAKKEG